MIDFIIPTIILIIFYFVIRHINRTAENNNRKILIFYSIVAILVLLLTFEYIELEGLVYFLYGSLLPVIIPFIIHFGIVFFYNKKSPQKKLKTKIHKGEKIVTLLGQKMIIIVFLIVTIVVNILLIIFSNRTGFALTSIIALSIVIVVFFIALLALLKYKTQKIVLIKGEQDYQIYLFDIPQNSLQIKSKTILTDESFIYDFIGVGSIFDLDNNKQEQHFVYQIKTKEAFESDQLDKQEDHYYQDFKSYINEVNNQNFKLAIKDEKIIHFYSKKQQ